MDSFDTQSSHALTADQIERLSVAVLDQFGSGLSRIELNQAVLMLLEDVAGIEVVPRTIVDSMLSRVWRRYRLRDRPVDK